ncbi:MAG: hypothetical protein ACXVJT_10345 [Thermoanaerobaculia bacterium]
MDVLLWNALLDRGSAIVDARSGERGELCSKSKVLFFVPLLLHQTTIAGEDSWDIREHWLGHRVFRRRYSVSPVWKKLAIAPAEPATTTTAQISSKMSMTRPATLNGFLICDETVRSCAVVKKNA